MSDVFVIRTNDILKVRAFFESLGLKFVEEKHGDGPLHYACEVNGQVLEIYPGDGSAMSPGWGTVGFYAPKTQSTFLERVTTADQQALDKAGEAWSELHLKKAIESLKLAWRQWYEACAALDESGGRGGDPLERYEEAIYAAKVPLLAHGVDVKALEKEYDAEVKALGSA
jgi:hypothetical protein